MYVCVAANVGGEERAEFTITVEGQWIGLRVNELFCDGIIPNFTCSLTTCTCTHIQKHMHAHICTHAHVYRHQTYTHHTYSFSLSLSLSLSLTHTPDVPLITVPPANTEASYGQDVTFSCTAVGPPDPQISWRRLDDDIQNGSVQAGNELHLFSMTVTDSGVYQCIATNVYGTRTATANLNILGNE